MWKRPWNQNDLPEIELNVYDRLSFVFYGVDIYIRYYVHCLHNMSSEKSLKNHKLWENLPLKAIKKKVTHSIFYRTFFNEFNLALFTLLLFLDWKYILRIYFKDNLRMKFTNWFCYCYFFILKYLMIFSG